MSLQLVSKIRTIALIEHQNISAGRGFWNRSVVGPVSLDE